MSGASETVGRERRPSLPRHGVGLEWVLVGERAHYVGDFAHIRPTSERPLVRCPQCRRQVSLKLGTVVAYHAAHRPGDECAATNPESALHINMKCYLADQLRRAVDARLRIHEPCIVGTQASSTLTADGRPADERLPWERYDEPCPERRAREWIDGWDDVAVEYRVQHAASARIPDVVLRHGGRVVAAIEVFVTHAVPPEKSAALAAMSIPWAEVRGDAALLSGATAWTPADPLPVVRTGDPRAWRCPSHQHAFDAWHAERRRVEAAQRRAEEAAREAARRSSVVLRARVVDQFVATGEWNRHVYTITEQRLDGTATAYRLSRDERTVAVAPIRADASGDIAASAASASAAIRAAFTHDAAALRRDGGAVVESPMHWASGDVVARLLAAASSDSDSKGRPLVARYPRRHVFSPRTGTWFVPTMLRGIRWDRAADDAFAEHPAWLRHQAAFAARREAAAAQRSPRNAPAPSRAPAPSEAHPGTSGLHPRDDSSAYRRSNPAVTDAGVVAEFGDAVAADEVASTPQVTVALLRTPPGRRRRALVFPHTRVTDRLVTAVIATLDHADADGIWLSARPDWSHRLDSLCWLPLERDTHQRGVVVVGETPMLSAAFANALAAYDDELTLRRLYTAGRGVAYQLPW